MKLLKEPNLEKDGFAVKDYLNLLDDDFFAAQSEAYAKLAPGVNASNTLSRGIRWGTYSNDRFEWLSRGSYHLSKEFNSEEGGRVRYFELLDECLLRRPETEKMLRHIFEAWDFEETSFERSFEIQLSAIRYEPTLAQPALPSPIAPHQDLIDGAIVVLRKDGDLIGGCSRLYSLAEEPLVEFNLNVGEALLVKDAKVLHQVTPIQLSPSETWRADDQTTRDILIVRYQPVGR